MPQRIIPVFFAGMLLVTSGDQWMVEKYLFTFGPGNFVPFPYLGKVPLIPIEANTLRKQVRQFHELCIY